MRLLRTALAVVASAALLVACAPGGAPVSESTAVPSPSVSQPTPTPTPTETGMAAFDTIDGVWCPADQSTACMTIQDRQVVADGTVTDTIADPTSDAAAVPCYSSYLADAKTGMGEVAVFYCPAGVVPEAGVNPNRDAVGFDRLYLTQNPPDVDTWFRASDLEAALNG